MKRQKSKLPHLCATLAIAALAAAPAVHAADWRLIGISGQQENHDLDVDGNFVWPDHTIWQVNIANASIAKVMLANWVNDSHSIGWCPTNKLVYHTAGSAAYSNNPLRVGHDQPGPDVLGVGYQDSQYLESINIATGVATGIYNCDPCPNPDPTLPCFGLVAPIPSWVLPAYRRDSTMIDPTNRVDGTNEPHAIRGLAWSTNKNLFYASDERGIFTMTTAGDCVILSNTPAFSIPTDFGTNQVFNDAKAIAFVSVGGQTKLWVGSRMDNLPSGNTNGWVMFVNTETGENEGQLGLNYPTGGGDPGDQFGGLLGLAQHPVTGVIYGLRKTFDSFSRELVTINPTTGDTTLVGVLGIHLTSMVFGDVGDLKVTSITRSGNDVNLAWIGALPPYQVQSRSSLAGGSWANVGAATTNQTATVVGGGSGPAAFYRVLGN